MLYSISSLALVFLGYFLLLRNIKEDSGDILIPWMIFFIQGVSDHANILLSPTNDLIEKFSGFIFSGGPFLVILLYVVRKRKNIFTLFKEELHNLNPHLKKMFISASLCLASIILLNFTPIGDEWYVEFPLILLTFILDVVALWVLVKEIISGHDEPMMPWVLWLLSVSILFFYELQTKGIFLFATIAPWVSLKTILFCLIVSLVVIFFNRKRKFTGLTDAELG